MAPPKLAPCASTWRWSYASPGDGVISPPNMGHVSLVGNGWEWGLLGLLSIVTINSYYGSLPHSLLSTSKHTSEFKRRNV